MAEAFLRVISLLCYINNCTLNSVGNLQCVFVRIFFVVSVPTIDDEILLDREFRDV